MASNQRYCPSANVTQRSQLPPLRFCTIIDGFLALRVQDPDAVDADFAVFDTLEEIRGLLLVGWCSLMPQDHLLVINCTGIQTMMHFRNNQRVGERRTSVHYYYNETFPANQQVVVGSCAVSASSSSSSCREPASFIWGWTD